MIVRNRPARAASIVLILTLLVSACGGTPGTNGAANTAVTGGGSTPSVAPISTPAPSAVETPVAEPAFPRTYVDATGKEVVIAKQPERVAVGHFAEMEYFFALDVPPVASPLAEEILVEFEVTLGNYAGAANVADLGDVTTLNMEKLLEVEPDLIIGSVGLHEQIYEQLVKIAPVVMLNLAGSWDENLLQYARIIGKEDKAEAYIADLTEVIKAANETLQPYRDETVAFVRIAGKDEFGAMGKLSYSYFFDTDNGLGLSAPEGYPDKWEILSLEAMTKLDADHIVIAAYASSYAEQLAEFEALQVWNSLKAVKNGHVHFLDISAATSGPLALKYAVPTITGAIAKR